MIDDYDLIVSSFQSQYGLRLSKEIHAMSWAEFRQMLIGIGPDTALGRMVTIRSENDEEILKQFSPEQKRIRNEWRSRRARSVTQTELQNVLDKLKEAFIAMAGGETDGSSECRQDRT